MLGDGEGISDGFWYRVWKIDDEDEHWLKPSLAELL